MEQLIVIMVFVALVPLALGAFVIQHLLGKKRTRELGEAALRMGLEFRPEGPEDLAAEGFASLPLFEQGHTRRARNMLVGQSDGVTMSILDYRHTIGHGKGARTHRQTVLAIQTPALSLPAFELRPEGLMHRIGSLFGYQDIDFEDDAEFSKRWLLRGEDEVGIREAFTPMVRGFFVKVSGLHVEGAGDGFIVYRPDKRVKPADLTSLMDVGLQLRSLLVGGP